MNLIAVDPQLRHLAVTVAGRAVLVEPAPGRPLAPFTLHPVVSTSADGHLQLVYVSEQPRENVRLVLITVDPTTGRHVAAPLVSAQEPHVILASRLSSALETANAADALRVLLRLHPDATA